MRIKSTRVLVGGLVAAAVGTAAFAMPSLASDGPSLVDNTRNTVSSVEAPDAPSVSETGAAVDEAPSPECEALFDELEAEFENWEPSEAEIDAINAETDELVAYLAENGVTVEVETDELGLRYPVLDDLTEDEFIDLIDGFYETYGFDDFDDDELPAGLEIGDEVDIELLEACEAEFDAEFDDFLGELEGCEALLGDVGDHFEQDHDDDADAPSNDGDS